MNDTIQHTHDAKPLEARLLGAIALNALIVVAEIAGGLVSGSLALLSDAIHNLSDVAALVIAFVARRLGRRPPSHRHTYGLGRVEVMAALFNSATILVVGTLIIRSAVARLLAPTPVLGGVMLAVASVGLAANLFSVLLLKGHSHGDLNMRAAVLHLLQDTLFLRCGCGGRPVVALEVRIVPGPHRFDSGRWPRSFQRLAIIARRNPGLAGGNSRRARP